MGDDVDLIIEAIARGMHRADLVIATGGLGPTSDDITKKSITKYFKRPLVLNEEVLKVLEDRYKARGINMPGINQNQALLPQGATFIPNQRGTAVGIVIEEAGHIFISLPGVPHEMEAMVSGWIADMIRVHPDRQMTIHRKLRTVGIFESALYEKISDLVEFRRTGETKISVAFLPSPRGIDLRLTGVTRNREEAQRLIGELELKITERVGSYIYGYDTDTLPDIVGALLRERKMKLAVAESCTGGLLGKYITDIPGSSDYFLGGIIAYSNDVKISELSVPSDIISMHGAVSEQCARFMADGVRQQFDAGLGISITGVAGPDGGTAEKPVGLTYIGLSSKDRIFVKEHRFAGDRERNRERASTIAMEMIRKFLIGQLA